MAKTSFLVTVSFWYLKSFYELISFQRDSYSTSKAENVNPYHPDPGQRAKINGILIFTVFLVPQKGVLKSVNVFIKPFWSTAMSYENKTLC